MTLDKLSKQDLLNQVQQQAELIDSLKQELARERDYANQYRYQAGLLDFVLDPVLSSDPDFKIITWNKAAEEFYGWLAEEVIGKRAQDLFHTSYLDDTDSQKAINALHHDGMWRGEVVHRRKDGTQAVLLATTAMINDEQDRVVGYVTILRDISKDLEAERALRESEERYRMISEIMSDYAYYYRLDDEGNWYHIWTTPDAYKRVTGYDQNEYEGSYGLYHPSEVERVKADVAKTLAGEDTGGEYQIITKSGDTKWIYINRRALWDNTGEKVIGLYGVGKDVTARRIADKRLQAYNREQDRMAILHDFIRDASHDLKTPISTINTSLYILQKYATTEKQEAQIHKLEHHVARLANLIEDMFTMSRLDLTASLNYTDFNLVSSLTDSILAHQSDADAKQITINYHADTDKLPVHADISVLQQALDHIIENAILYTPEKGEVTVRAVVEQDHIRVSICDTGMGIPEDELPYIFDRFYRGDKARSSTSSASTGLGLSITRKIITLHQGTIDIDSRVGEGTCITITIPSP